jgi:hypothetical protein
MSEGRRTATPAHRVCVAALIACAALLLPAARASAGERYALVITGASGGEVYAKKYTKWRSDFIQTLGEKFHYDPQRLIALAEQASRPHGLAGTALLDRYDRYYLSRTRQRPLPVLLVRVNDAEQSRYYIDPKTARVVYSYSAKTWMSRWLYHGLHSLDFPWLYDHRPLWDIVVITFMLGGTALCVTSLILAWRVIGTLITAR